MHILRTLFKTYFIKHNEILAETALGNFIFSISPDMKDYTIVPRIQFIFKFDMKHINIFSTLQKLLFVSFL